MRIAALRWRNLNGTNRISHPISHTAKHGITRRKILIKAIDRREGRRLERFVAESRRGERTRQKYTLGISQLRPSACHFRPRGFPPLLP